VKVDGNKNVSIFVKKYFFKKVNRQFKIYMYKVHHIWPGSSVGITTGYGLEGPDIESRWGRDFPHLSRPALGPTQPPV
jgi:hypothetical protein